MNRRRSKSACRQALSQTSCRFHERHTTTSQYNITREYGVMRTHGTTGPAALCCACQVTSPELQADSSNVGFLDQENHSREGSVRERFKRIMSSKTWVEREQTSVCASYRKRVGNGVSDWAEWHARAPRTRCEQHTINQVVALQSHRRTPPYVDNLELYAVVMN